MILPPAVAVPLALAKRVPLWAWLGALALVFALASGHYRQQRNEARAALNAHLQADADAVAAAKAAAKAAEAEQARIMADAVALFEKEKRNAIAKERAVVAGLRAGNLRLREQWRGCVAGAQAAAGGQGGDGADELRAASAGRIVRVGAEADAKVNYLQGLIRSAPACFEVQ